MKQWFLFACMALACTTPAQAASKAPNIVMIVADDLGWADVGFHGSNIATPSLDRLAREGVELSRFYTTPICSPTRAALMTGRDPMRLGVAYATIMPWHNNGIHPDETFLPQQLKANGYQTAMIGKWHLGHSQQTYHPNEKGFEHFYGHLHTEVGYWSPFKAQGGVDFQRNGVTVNDEGYETFLMAREAARWLKARDKSKPFFLYMPFLAPHTPLEAPKELIDKYATLKDDRPKSRSKNADRTRLLERINPNDNSRQVYAAVVDALDQAIGRVLNVLDEEQVADDTLVFFISDNGGATYAGGGASNAPFRGGKGDTFEGGIRVVAVMRYPSMLSAGSRYDEVFSVMDVFPTFSRAAGIEPDSHYPLDGLDHWQALLGKAEPPEREKPLLFLAETPIKGSVSATAFDERWKLVQRIEQGQLSADVTNYLFDIENDPYEYNNLAEQYPDKVQAFAEEIRVWRALYPNGGTRSNLVPPPGWRAPLDWSSYPQPLAELQAEPAPGMPPARGIKFLDRMHGAAGGRLIYNCVPTDWLAGICREQPRDGDH